MIIGIDGNEANVKSRVGVNQYAFELLWAMRKLQDKNALKHDVNVYLKNEPSSELPKASEKWKYKVIAGDRLWIIRNFMPYLFSTHEKPDVLFSPNHYVPPLCPVPRVVAIMDLGYLASPGQFKAYDFWQLRLWTAWSLFVSRKVVAISEATQKDIVKHYPFASKKTSVTLLSGDSSVESAKISVQNIDSIKKKYLIGKNYILFLSTLKPSKNVTGLLGAWAKIHNEFGRDHTLVIAGKKGWLYEPIFDHVKKLKLEKSVVFTDFVPENEKLVLLAGAKVFVLPSFWEGFGIDVVNAMKLGVPVVVSSRGSLPEVAGGVGEVVDPEDHGSIARSISKILKMPQKEYNKLSEESISYARRFSWEKTAQKTVEAIESIIK